MACVYRCLHKGRLHMDAQYIQENGVALPCVRCLHGSNDFRLTDSLPAMDWRQDEYSVLDDCRGRNIHNHTHLGSSASVYTQRTGQNYATNLRHTDRIGLSHSTVPVFGKVHRMLRSARIHDSDYIGLHTFLHVADTQDTTTNSNWYLEHIIHRPAIKVTEGAAQPRHSLIHLQL